MTTTRTWRPTQSHFEMVRKEARKIEETLRAFEIHPAEAARIVLAVNSHEALVDAAKALLACAGAAEHWTEDERQGASHLRAAIAKAEGAR